MVKLYAHIIAITIYQLFSLSVSNLKAQIIINEIMPANSSMFMDPTYNYGGWIELYNTGEKDESLVGYYLSDNSKEPQKYQIEDKEAIVPAKGFFVLWFDHNDLDSRQVNFKLDCNGGKIYLFDPQGNTVLNFEFPIQSLNTSYARTEDGASEWSYCITPTPGKSNNGSSFSFQRCPKPTFTLNGGLFNQPAVVNITAPSTMEVRYTTDGSEPNENSNLWTGQKTLTETTILRARIFSKGYLPGPIITHSYIFSDREITLPVVSIVTDPKNLWDDEMGIYCIGTNGKYAQNIIANFNQEWERPANFEIIKDKEQVFAQECDIAIGGAYSRRYDIKTLKLHAEKKYDGNNRFNYPFFQAKPGLSFKSLLLRNEGNDRHHILIKDALLQSLVGGIIDIDYQAYQPAVQYINGEYYGIISIRERNNHQYVYSNYGYDKEEIDLVTANRTPNGTYADLNTVLSMSHSSTDPSVYQAIEKKMEMDEYIAYLITEIYVGNKDWIDNNLKIFRHQDNGKWRWLLYDLDEGFHYVTDNPLSTKLHQHGGHTAKMFRNLLDNPGFKQRFIDYSTVCLGTVFERERVYSVIDSIANGIRSEVPYHEERWQLNHFEKGILALKEIAKERTKVVLQQIKEYFSLDDPVPLKIESTHAQATLLMNDIEIPLKRLNGHTFKGTQIKVKAIAPIGYQFKRWNKMDTNNTIIQSFSHNEITVHANSDLRLQAEFIADNTLLIPVRINEISASNDIHLNEYFKKEDWIELYNTTDSPVSIAGLFISLEPENPTQYQIPDCGTDLTIIPPYGYRILWADKNENLTQLHLPFKLPADGGTLQLTRLDENKDVLWHDKITYTKHSSVGTFGRYPDGSNETYLLNRNTFSGSNLFSPYDIKSGSGLTGGKVTDKDYDINIYYNYGYSTLCIEIKEGFSSNQDLIIYNLVGYAERNYTIPKETSNYSIDVSDLSNGYHLVSLICPNGKKVIMKFIK